MLNAAIDDRAHTFGNRGILDFQALNAVVAIVAKLDFPISLAFNSNARSRSVVLGRHSWPKHNLVPSQARCSRFFRAPTKKRARTDREEHRLLVVLRTELPAGIDGSDSVLFVPSKL
jgi:hypothetical protein